MTTRMLIENLIKEEKLPPSTHDIWGKKKWKSFKQSSNGDVRLWYDPS